VRDSNLDPSDAARRLGSIKSEKKAQSSRDNILAAKAAGKMGGKPPKPLNEITCTCGRGETLEGHPTTCPRGRAIRRWQKAGRL
jgi:hypothetical protein